MYVDDDDYLKLLTEYQEAQMDRQKIIDIMFQIVDRMAEYPIEDQETRMAWVREQYRLCGLNLTPMGMSWGVIVLKGESCRKCVCGGTEFIDKWPKSDYFCEPMQPFPDGKVQCRNCGRLWDKV